MACASWYALEAMESDGELARRVAEGGAAKAEQELCRRFAPRIRLYGLKHLRDEERARDLVQSVLVAVLEALRAGRLEDPERIDRFVLGTARNLALHAHRERVRATPTDPADLDVAGVAPDPARLDVGSLFKCMEGLDVRARTVLQLSFYRDKSAEEIAGVLATTAGNVRVVRHRAMTQLRTCLDARRAP